MSNAIHLNKTGVKILMKKSIIALMAFSMLGLFSININAQDADSGEPTKKKTEDVDNKRYGSYLAVSHAKHHAEKNQKQNRRLLGDLLVIVANFGTEGQKKQLDDANQEFKQGVKELYRRKYLEADDILSSNKKNIASLYTEMVNMYHAKAVAILTRCTEAVVDMELSINKTGNVSPTEHSGRTKKVHANMRRLAIAYDQFNEGTFYRQEKGYTYATKHFRVSITQGVAILMDLTESETEKKKLRDEFQKELLDVENRIANSEN